MNKAYLSEFGGVLLFIIGGIVFVCGGLLTAMLIRAKRPNPEKLTTYECGEEPIGNAWGKFNIRFYIVALMFILFEVEVIFLFPWATIFANKELIEETNGLWGWFSLVEVILFIAILALGLVYAWVKGYLDWVKPNPEVSTFKGKVPHQLYDQINEKYSSKEETK